MTRPSTKAIITGAVIVIAAAGIVGAFKFISMPASGSIAPPVKVAQPAADKTLTAQGQYVSFSYPSSFTATPVSKPVAPVVDAYSFVRHKIGSWQLDVQVSRLQTGLLDDNGSYNYRNKTPTRFIKSTETSTGQTAVIFTDQTQQPFAKVAFLKKGNTSISISLAGGTSEDTQTLQSILNDTIASVRWK